MAAEADLSTPERVRRLLTHLGIRRAHVVGAMPEVVELAVAVPDKVASLTMVCPFQKFAAERLESLGSRLLFVHGDRGPSAPIGPGALMVLSDAAEVVLGDFVDVAWADPAADRGSELVQAMRAFLAGVAEADMADPSDAGDVAGEVAGITYRIQGSGPPLVLFPLSLAASQWEPLLPVLSQQYRTVTLGGRHIGPVAILALRARQGYGTVVRQFVADTAPKPEERVLEVGCGSGEVTRVLACHTGSRHPIVGIDINRYLLREAASLADAEGWGDRVTFREGSAEALPLPDDSFDLTVSCTVMEEVNADRMLAEMLRVTRPGGRIGVMVRAVDMRAWIGLPLPPELMARAEVALGAGVSEGGCADASLYRRFVAAGLTQLTMGPRLAPNHVGPGFTALRRSFEAGQRAGLSPDALKVWDAAVAQADAEGTFMWANALHCAVGTKP